MKTEQALSGALVQVTSGRATKVCITDGHGEWSLDAGGERALLIMKDELKRENIETEALATRGKSSLPKECDAIFVLGPIKAFSSEESEALKKYVDAGGNLLLALDPVISGETARSHRSRGARAVVRGAASTATWWWSWTSSACFRRARSSTFWCARSATTRWCARWRPCARRWWSRWRAR